MPSPKIELGRAPLLAADSPVARPAPAAGTTSKTKNVALAVFSGVVCVAAVAVLSGVTLGAGLFLALIVIAALSGVTAYVSGRHAYELRVIEPAVLPPDRNPMAERYQAAFAGFSDAELSSLRTTVESAGNLRPEERSRFFELMSRLIHHNFVSQVIYQDDDCAIAKSALSPEALHWIQNREQLAQQLFIEFQRVFPDFMQNEFALLSADKMNDFYFCEADQPKQIQIGEHSFDLTEQLAKDYARLHCVILSGLPNDRSLIHDLTQDDGQDRKNKFPALYEGLVALATSKDRSVPESALLNRLFELITQSPANTIAGLMNRQLDQKGLINLNAFRLKPSYPTIIVQKVSDEEFRFVYEVDAVLQDANRRTPLPYKFEIRLKKTGGNWEAETSRPEMLNVDASQRESARYLQPAASAQAAQ